MQAGILADLPPLSRYLRFALVPGADPKPGLRRLARVVDGQSAVVGLGATLLAAWSARAACGVAGLRPFPSLPGTPIAAPATPADLWVWLRGDDRGALFHTARALAASLGPESYRLLDAVDGFRHREGRDLSGYVDGTENPQAEQARGVAIVSGAGAGLDGGSFVAVQQWRHDFAAIEAMRGKALDQVIGRRLKDNQELAKAPDSAHVKRTAQEDFEPAAFSWRRSMPWVSEHGGGLMFVSFGASLDAFEAQWRRMLGLDDGITDAVFRISQPTSGGYFWCPPVQRGSLDLRVLGR